MLENQWMWTYLKKIAGTSNGERQKPTAQQYIVAVTGNTISTQSIKKNCRLYQPAVHLYKTSQG
jgi:hypothetical protein